MPQSISWTAACTARSDEPDTPTVTVSSISSRMASFSTGGTSAIASGSPEVEQVTPSAPTVTYSVPFAMS